jgi:hypothetical protein
MAAQRSRTGRSAPADDERQRKTGLKAMNLSNRPNGLFDISRLLDPRVDAESASQEVMDGCRIQSRNLHVEPLDAEGSRAGVDVRQQRGHVRRIERRNRPAVRASRRDC